MRNRVREQVWQRAKHTCEYCRVPQAFYRTPFHVDHVISRQHGGRTELENLALACFHCNMHKGPNVAGIDPDTGELCPLYNPRQQIWSEHFRWHGAILIGRTAVGRVTVKVLAMNLPLLVAVRESLIAEGVFPMA